MLNRCEKYSKMRKGLGGFYYEAKNRKTSIGTYACCDDAYGITYRLRKQ